MTDYTKKVVVGSLFVFVFTVLAAICGYLVRIIIARTLTSVEFGLLYSIFGTFGLFSILQQMGLNESLSKFIAEFKVRNENGKIKSAIIFTIVFQLATSFVLATVFWVLAPYLAKLYFKNDLAVRGVRMAAIFVFLAPIENLFLSIFRGYQKSLWYSFALFARMFFVLVSTIVLFNFSKTIFSPIISYILVYSLSFLIYMPYFLTRLFPNFLKTKTKAFRDTSKKIFLFGLPIIITTVASSVITSTDTVMITYFKTLDEVAVYNVAMPTASLLWFFGSSIAIILLPLTSEMLKKKHLKLMEQGIELIYKYSIFIVLPITIVMFIFPDTIINILFGGGYSSGIFILQVLSIAAIFFTIGQINGAILSGLGKPAVNAKITAFAALLNFTLNFVLIPSFGIIGAAIATAIAISLIGILSVIQLKREIKFRIPVVEWGKIIFCSLLFLVILIILKKYLLIQPLPKIILSVLCGILAYIFIAIATKTLNIKELKTIKTRIMK
ncbi:MAG: oligosaccharide flippase family protein [Candidatus Woesearchaeota archaeon]